MPDMLALCEETKRLTALPEPDFAPKTAIAVADAILFESSAPANGAAVALLQQRIAGTVGTPKNFGPCTQAPGLHRKGPACGGRLLKEAVLAGKLGGAPRAALIPGACSDLSSPKVLAVAQQAIANATRAEAGAARHGEEYFMQRLLACHPFPHLPLSVFYQFPERRCALRFKASAVMKPSEPER
jgi:hypothetical protein